MRTQAPRRRSILEMVSTGWKLLSVALAGVFALAVYVALTVAENPYIALGASIAVGPLLVLPMTRRLVWLVLAGVAGVALTAALMWSVR
jgi:hypothetical protein